MQRRILSSSDMTVSFWILITLAIAFVLALGVVLTAFFLRRRSAATGAGAKKPKHAVNPGRPKDASVPFSLDEILSMTGNWDPKNVIEDGGHSSVYVGNTSNGGSGSSNSSKVAVKRAKKVSKEGGHMFRNEVAFLGHVRHPNIIPFIGSCDANQEQILVFEFIPNGSLSSWLRPTGDQRPLNFATRLNIAIDVAEALAFMHSFTKPCIIHRDVKSDTILLDSSFRARLGGLGLLKHLPGDAMRIRMERKKGYLDPEYFQTFKVTTKCDIYSFGVVLLEMITGKPPIMALPEEGGGEASTSPGMTTTLPQWALPAIASGRIEDILDPRIPMSGHTLGLVVAFAQVASACVAPLRKDRPDMAQVLPLLAEIKESTE